MRDTLPLPPSPPALVASVGPPPAGELLVSIDEHAIVSVADRNGRIVYVNDRFCSVSGYGREELIGADHRIINSGTHGQEFFRTMWDTITAGQVWRGTIRNRAKDGRLYWVASTIVPVLDASGRPQRFISLRTDITREMQLEQEIRHQHAFLASITEAVGEGILVADAQGRCLYASGEALRLLRRERDELIGQPLQAMVLESMELARDAQAAAAALPALQWPMGNVGAVFRRGNGARLHVALSLRPFAGSGPEAGTVIAFRANAVERRARSRERRAGHAAERASRAKTSFLATMSHEIRTPLSAVVGLARLALDEPAGSNRVRPYLERILDSAMEMTGLVADVLDLAKIEAGKLVLEQLPFDLRELLHGVRDSCAEQAAERGLAFAVRLDPALPQQVLGDATRVRQIVVNYVTNALKFTVAGSVWLRARPLGGGLIRIEVADTGIGIEPAVLARLFEPFTQADSGITRRYGGSGLGLSICRDLARAMGGAAGADSTPGRGSTFWVELKLPAAPPTAPDTVTGDADLAGLRVLLVEDNEVNVMIARALLERWGATVIVAGNGVQALAALARPAAAFDLVLMDLHMPEMGGREATARIREHFDPEQLPIVALTAAAMDHERQECLAMGMNDYLTKPIAPEVLRAAVARACRVAAR